jgi:hypothetical protein
MAFTFVNANGASDDAGDTSAAVTITGVQAGDSVAVWLKWEGGSTTTTMSDGTSSLTGATARNHANGGLSGRWFYLLSSVATGSVTYTCTWGASRDFKRLIGFVFRPTGTVTFNTGTDASSSGASTAVTSGNYSTTGSGSWAVLGGFGEFNVVTLSTNLINGGAADGVTNAGVCEAWYKILSATFTGGASSATQSTSDDWVCGALALNDDEGGGAAGQPTMARFGGVPGMTPGGLKAGRTWFKGLTLPKRKILRPVYG